MLAAVALQNDIQHSACQLQSFLVTTTHCIWWQLEQQDHYFAVYKAAATPVPRLVGMANGIVLEVGPWSGNQFPRFNRSSISGIYGIEPNEQLFRQLQNETIKRHRLGDIYVPINPDLEDNKLLKENWDIGDGGIDSVVCMQVLCPGSLQGWGLIQEAISLT